MLPGQRRALAVAVSADTITAPEDEGRACSQLRLEASSGSRGSPAARLPHPRPVGAVSVVLTINLVRARARIMHAPAWAAPALRART